MTSLLIDTCTEHGVIVFFSGTTPRYEGTIPKGLHNSKYMIVEIDKGLKKLSLEVKDLDFIAVTIGPGSYTGIRVGVIAAKTLSYAADIPIITLCSLDGYTPNQDGDFISIIDAKISGGYYRVGKKTEEKIEWKTEPAVCELEKLPALQKIHHLVTPNKQLLEKKLAKIYPETVFVWEEIPPGVNQFIRIANEKFQAGKVESSTEFELMYLRKTQAEIERDEKNE
ncbi:MAG: tRNA (adenosine(37)-N6)-threonylcarbamoyltransferase complex dimerization subunit type 1 TsaB [Chlamydiota bacterium]